MKIQIRKVNGVPMGRPKNEHRPLSYSESFKMTSAYDAFEQSVTEHEAPGFEEGEAEGVLQWQHLRNPTTPTSKWQNCDEDDLDFFSEFGDSFQQIWIVSTPEKVEVKEADNWIRVEDENPPYYKPIFIYNHYDSSWALAWYASDGDNGFYTVFGTDLVIYNITHWQLANIPSPPTH